MSAYVVTLTPTNSLWPVTIAESVVQVDVLQAFVAGGGGGGGTPGPQGPQGDHGPAGAAGATGAQGPVGPGSLTRRVDASECIPRTVNGAGISVIETATNAVNVDVLDFDAATSESANVWPEVPRGVTITGITITPRWTADSGSGGVVLAFAARWFQNDDAIDQAMGTAQTSTDTFIDANDWHIGPTTATITPAGSWAADADLCIVVLRDTANGSDALGVDLRLASFEITYLT